MERGKSTLSVQYYPLCCKCLRRLRDVLYRSTEMQGKVNTRKEIEINGKKGNYNINRLTPNDPYMVRTAPLTSHFIYLFNKYRC